MKVDEGKKPAPEPRTPGGDAETVIISADFDAPLDEFDQDRVDRQ